MSKHTPAPWFVREMVRHGQLHGYFVAAADVNGFAYDAEIMGEDEYRDGMERWKADASLIAAAPDMLNALKAVADLKGWNETAPISATGIQVMQAIAKAEGGHP